MSEQKFDARLGKLWIKKDFSRVNADILSDCSTVAKHHGPPATEAAMSSQEELLQIFNESTSSFAASNKEQLAYRHMIALAEVLEGWTMDARMSPERSAQILGWAEALDKLAEEVGPDWDPPQPARLTLMGFLGRKALDE